MVKKKLQLRGIAAGSALLLTLLLLLPWLARASLPASRPCPSAAMPVRVVAWNVSRENVIPSRAVDFLARSGADAIVLIEAKGWTADVPSALLQQFPYQQDCHPRIACSTLILTRRAPVRALPLGRGDVENRQGLSAVRVDMAEGPSLVALHLSRPWPVGRQADELAALAPQAGPDSVFAGDFNMTPLFPALRRFIREGGLTLATPGGGSWPAHLGGVSMPPVLALDHFLLGANWGGRAAWGPALGSDHRPLIADLCRLRGHA